MAKSWIKMVCMGVIILVMFASAFCLAADNATATKVSYSRNETLVCAGGLWGPPSNWNPLNIAATPPGLLGLVYETLYWYDPLTNEMIPWLAEKTEWSGKVYKVKVRRGIQWSDGKPLTAKDVKFTWELAKQNEKVYYHHMWEWLSKIELIDDYTVNFIFSDPHYQEWDHFSYLISILPEHIWSKKSSDEVINGTNENAVGCGPYLFGSYNEDKMVYIKNENWWAIKALGLNPAPKQIEYLKIYDNNVAMGMLLKGELDFCNFLLPGVPEVKKYYPIHTWYQKAPYMLSDSTSFLFINTTKKPMNDSRFRRAMAFAIDSSRITTEVYHNQVVPANPLGFLPIKEWMRYYDKNIVNKYGFKYDVAKAKTLLEQAGYRDKNGDGFRETPDGEAISLTIMVPNGWVDWMDSVNIIAANLKAVGINVKPVYPDFGQYSSDLVATQFDLTINNFHSFPTNTVWTMLDWIYKDVKALDSPGSYTGNYGRYDNQDIARLVKQLNCTPLSNTAGNQKIISKISEISLKEMPVIPLWYNGMWFQASEKYWENWPDEKNPYAYPSTWLERWQCGTVKLLTVIKPKTK